MRCRKVRSYLSAYCKDELNSRQKLAVTEHLATCSVCRIIEADYRQLAESNNLLAEQTVSNDFNTKLFERLAQERFAETRKKAYLPKRAPVIRWPIVVPSTVAVLLVFLFGVVTFQSGIMNHSGDMVSVNNRLDDSYLNVQPTNNPNMTDHMQKEWSLPAQLARAERLTQRTQRIFNQLGGNNVVYPQTVATNVSAPTTQPVPYTQTYYRVRRNVQIYQAPSPQKGVTAY